MKETLRGYFTILLGVLVCALIVATILQAKALTQSNNALADVRGDLRMQTDALTAFQDAVTDRFSNMEQKFTSFSDQLYIEQKRINNLAVDVNDFDRDVHKLSGSVDNLEKLTTTDPELLQKYSRVYFLNEHYIPSDLVVIDEKYDLKNGKEVSIHGEVWYFLKDLLEEADDDKVDLMVLSGYRSFEEQQSIKESYTVRYGSGANTFSADQGYSEHQLGTAVDFTNNTIGQAIDSFDQTEEFEWLKQHAYKYGFIMSYPENNEYYVYEPWHWRFVGKDLARKLHRDDQNFYDMEQREIDGYLGTLFDR